MNFIIPTFDSSPLNEIAFSIKKRSKAIKYHVHDLTVERVHEVDDQERREKIECKIWYGSSSVDPRLEIFVWEDRWVIVSVFKFAKKGYDWRWRDEGRLLGSLTGRQLVGVVEETIALFYQMNDSQTSEFDELWSPLVAKGPTVVR